MDAIGELADLLMVRMLVIRKRGVTTHLTWPNCILIYVNTLVNMQITAGRRFFANNLYCDLESAAAGTVGQRATWPHKNY